MLRDGSRIQLDLVPVFQIDKILLDQPKATPLPLHFERAAGRTVVAYRWLAQEKQFAMPVRVGLKDAGQIIMPTTAWQRRRTNISKDDFAVATDHYYIKIKQ